MEQNEETIKRLTESINKIDEQKNRIFFYSPSIPQASGGVGVLYEHVKTLTDLGYDVTVVYESSKEQPYLKPEWLGTEYTSLPHCQLDKIGKIGPEDLLVIPEGMSHIMEQTQKLSCIRVILCQSYLYVLGALMPGMSWSNFGIQEVIVVASTLQEYIERIFGKGRFKIKTCAPSINENIFKIGKKPKKPIIAISSRDRMMTTNVIKQFYAIYPQFRWITFKEMTGLTREEYSEQLQDACLGIWLDRVAGFGTFPIECAKTNTPFIALIPDIIPEFAKDNRGIWTNNIMGVPELIAQYLKLWLEDKEPQEVLDGIAELATLYTKADEEKNIQEIYSEYFDKRKEEINLVIEKLKGEELVPESV